MLASVLTLALFGAGTQDPAQDAERTFAPPPLTTLAPSGLGYRVVPVAGSKHVAVVLAVRCGFDHDPPGRTGLARAIGEVLRLSCEKGALAPFKANVRCLGAATMVTATVECARLPDLLGALRAILAGELVVDDDARAQAVARAKLRGDEETRIVPGLALYWRARRTLLAGDPRGRLGPGVDTELDAIDRDELAAAVRARMAPRNALLIAVGGEDEKATTDAITNAFAALVPGAEPPSETVHDSAPPVEADVTHERVDAPFVSCALKAPRWGDEGFLPFVIAIGALRGRAARTFQDYRGGEVHAWFEFVAYSYLDEPGVALIDRRGRNGDTVERTRAEIESLLADLRDRGAMDQEISFSLREVSQSLALPPYDRAWEETAARRPEALYPRALVLAMYTVFDWPADLVPLLQKTTVGAVGQALQDAIQKDRLRWFSIRPVEHAR